MFLLKEAKSGEKKPQGFPLLILRERKSAKRQAGQFCLQKYSGPLCNH